MPLISNKKLSELSPLEKPMVVEIQPEVIIKSVRIESLIDSHFQYIGRGSGKQYEWKRAGDTVLVDVEDVEELLSKRLGTKSCCGNEPNKIFQLAQ